MKRKFLQYLLISSLLGLGACSTVESLFSSGNEPVTRTSSNQAPPNLGSVPERPQPSQNSNERAATAGALAADRANARYTDEELRGRAPETPPPAPRAPTPLPPSAAPVRPTPPAAPAQPAAQAPQPAQPAPQTAPRAQTPPPAQAAPSAQTAAPASPAQPRIAAPQPQSAEQVFAQQFNNSGQRTLGSQPQTQPQPAPAPAATAAAPAQPFALAGGGSLREPTRLPLAPAAQNSTRSVQDQRLQRLDIGVIYFEAGSASLSQDDMHVVRGIVRYHQQHGGIIRLVGHASSRTDNMAPERHRETNFNVSLQRAQAVAAALVRQGIRQDSILVEAHSDQNLVYYEAMPIAESYNRRVEIFIEN